MLQKLYVAPTSEIRHECYRSCMPHQQPRANMNVTEALCRTNNSDIWLMTTPVCSTRYHNLDIFVLVAVILSVITLWTILGNVLVLIALFRYRTLRTMSNCLIGNLAISDLLLALTVLPISAGHDLLGYWVFGESTCTIWLCIDVLYCTASIWGLCTVAFDRCLATAYPVWYHDQRSVKKAVGCIVFVWIFSIVISVAPFIGWRHMIPSFFTFNPRIRRYECVLFTSSSYVLYSAIGSFIFPAILMAFMYIRIFAVLHSQSQGLQKVSLASKLPVYASNRNPEICLSNDEAVNDEGMDSTTVTLLSNRVENSSNMDEKKDVDVKINKNHLLMLRNGNSLLLDSSVATKTTTAGCKEHICIVPQPKTAFVSSGNRSNSFAIPSAAKLGRPGEGNLLSVVDLDRRNSHNESMHRPTSDSRYINTNTPENKLSSACQRSKSASALSSEEEGETLRTSPIPRRSLPSHMSIFRRNSHMTMSMKRRFELREQRATKRMLLIMACFCICWMPFLFMYILRSVCRTCVTNHHLVAAIIWLGYVNSSLNPILYTLFNDDFRRAFRKLLTFQSNISTDLRRMQ